MLLPSVRIAALIIGAAAMAVGTASVAQEARGPVAAQGTEGDTGQQAFNNACRTCHMVREGDNRLGPNLHKVVGRKAGSLPDYAFSSAMKEAGFTWDEEKLDRFIANPDQVVPGNGMKPYGGLASSDERKKIIAFLAQPR